MSLPCSCTEQVRALPETDKWGHPPSPQPTAPLLKEFWGVREGRGFPSSVQRARQEAGKEAAAKSHRKGKEKRGPALVPALAGFPGGWSSGWQGYLRLVGWPSA